LKGLPRLTHLHSDHAENENLPTETKNLKLKPITKALAGMRSAGQLVKLGWLGDGRVKIFRLLDAGGF